MLDVMLPRLDGFGALDALREHATKSTPVLMLSALDSVDDRVRSRRAGAGDYLVKPFDVDELIARLQVLVRCTAADVTTPSEPTHLALADLTLDRLSRRVQRGRTRVDLQPKEFTLLEYLGCNAGRTLTRAMILEHAWRWTFDPQTNVVNVFVLRQRNKIDRGSGPKLIHKLRGVGYVLRAD